MNKYIVYIKTDENGRIIAVNSSAFLHSFEGWQEIDSGVGDQFRHAQGHYFPQSIRDENGICRYKLVDGIVIERTREEMDEEHVEPIEQPSVNDRVTALEEALAVYEIAYMEGVQSA